MDASPHVTHDGTLAAMESSPGYVASPSTVDEYLFASVSAFSFAFPKTRTQFMYREPKSWVRENISPIVIDSVQHLTLSFLQSKAVERKRNKERAIDRSSKLKVSNDTLEGHHPRDANPAKRVTSNANPAIRMVNKREFVSGSGKV